MTWAEWLEEERKQKSYNLYENIIEILGTKGEKYNFKFNQNFPEETKNKDLFEDSK